MLIYNWRNKAAVGGGKNTENLRHLFANNIHNPGLLITMISDSTIPGFRSDSRLSSLSRLSSTVTVVWCNFFFSLDSFFKYFIYSISIINN